MKTKIHLQVKLYNNLNSILSEYISICPEQKNANHKKSISQTALETKKLKVNLGFYIFVKTKITRTESGVSVLKSTP